MILPFWVLYAFLGGIAVLSYFLYASFAFGAGYQPAPRAVVDRMLDDAAVGPEDTLFDLGAGTGAIIFRAARERGARVVGIEVEPLRILILRLRRWVGGPRDRIRIQWGNLYRTDFRRASVVAVFLWPEAMERLRPLLETQLAPGSRVVSHWHPVVGWTPTSVDPRTRVYLYRWPDARLPTSQAPAG
ncbi:MAG: SAM-dependent methyltransferase [Thermoplasmata archaeon]|nr:SAM-dependent methyltransferase [Thermoplasmata archaeon]